MALKSYVAMALFICGVAWLWATGSQQVGAERQAVASQYSLGAQQMTVYDKCIRAMEHRALHAGGSKQQFCGCLTQRGLSLWLDRAWHTQASHGHGPAGSGFSGSNHLQRRHTQQVDVCRSNAILVR
jgi:hypothetical protein